MLTSNQKKFIRILKELGIYKRWLGNKRDYDRMIMNFNDTHPNVSQKLPDSPYFSFMIARSFIWDQTKERNMWDRLHGILHIKQTLMGDPHPLNSFINCSFCWSDTNHETMWLRLYQTKAAQYTCEEALMNDAVMAELKQVVKRYIFSR